jgi:hypothetical protein
MINHEEKYAYIHIAKTGGHSVGEWLGTDKPPPHYKSCDLKIAYPDYFQFATVRNTWEILVSSYVFFEVERYFSFEVMIKEALFSDETKFMFHSKEGQLEWIFNQDDNICVDFICNTNHLQKHLNELNNLTNIGYKKEVKHLNKSNKKDYRFFYKRDHWVDLVYKKYKKEIDLFGFDFENKYLENENLFGKILSASNYIIQI